MPLTLLLLFLTLLPAAAEIVEVEIDGLKYKIDTGRSKACVSGYSYRGQSWDCVIPSSINYEDRTYAVTTIGGWAFYDCRSLTSVAIPNSVATIEYCAFKNCESLTSITIPDSVTEIGSEAFRNCESLTSVTIPNSVTTIEESAFYGCSSLTSVTIPNSVTTIGEKVFCGCSSLTSVTIPNSVTTIGGWAFYECSSLTSVIIPNSVTTIGELAFYGCSSLASVTIPNSVTSIEYQAFYGCSSLTSVIIPNSVTTIEGYAFYGCSSLASVTIPNSVTSIGQYTFYGCSSLTSVTIPSSMTDIGTFAFCGCNSLISIEVDNACSQYASLDGVLYDKSFTILKCCPGGKNHVVIPNSVTRIGYYAFSECDNLTSVTIPNSVHSIADFAFYGCSSLSEITIGDLNTSIEPTLTIDVGTFVNCPVTKLTIGTVVKEIKEYAFLFAEDSSIEKVEMADMAQWTKNNDISQLADTYTLLVLAPLHNGVLKNFSRLKSLTIPCLSGSVDSPGNFGELFGTESFADTRAVLQYFEDGTSKTYYIPTSLEELTISEGCGILPFGGLSNCNMLKKVTLPASLYMVGEKALFGCAGITDVYCQGADPATAFSNSFDDMRLTSCKLHVPYDSIDLYKVAEGWKRFNCIQEDTSVDSITDDAAVISGYYNLHGERSDTPWSGVNIVTYSDGSVRKMIRR